jgi:2-(1,2-epoxy-1,2-dihydrophenyl)acetyl-CoA isomerase
VTNLLLRTIGLQKAKLLTLTGERIDGRTAESIGLVADAVPASDLEAWVDELVERLLDRSPTSGWATKGLLNAGSEVTYEESLEREANAGQHLLRTEEYERAIREFFES